MFILHGNTENVRTGLFFETALKNNHTKICVSTLNHGRTNLNFRSRNLPPVIYVAGTYLLFGHNTTRFIYYEYCCKSSPERPDLRDHNYVETRSATIRVRIRIFIANDLVPVVISYQ